jgi:hypothetical protein
MMSEPEFVTTAILSALSPLAGNLGAAFHTVTHVAPEVLFIPSKYMNW